jgi:hypothetical protein
MSEINKGLRLLHGMREVILRDGKKGILQLRTQEKQNSDKE